MLNIADFVRPLLVCPLCGNELQEKVKALSCLSCQSDFPENSAGVLDLRPSRPKDVTLTVKIGTHRCEFPRAGFRFHAIDMNPDAPIDYTTMPMPARMGTDIASYLPKAERTNSVALDLGCGTMIHRKILEYAGFQYIGIDYADEAAMMLGDAHTLPFRDESFECVLSIAALQLMHNPFVVSQEVFRVLKPSGRFVGTVAFLESFHNSCFHFTNLGTYQFLQSGGFIIDRIAPSWQWTSPESQLRGYFPKMPTILAKLLVTPLKIMHRAWWRLGSLFSEKATENNRLLAMTGSFVFVATRP